MTLTYYGHSCFGVTIGAQHLLFDPFITGNPLVGDKVDIQTIPCDFMFISHGHSDHILDAEAIAKRTGCKVIAAYEIISWLNKKGVTNTHPMNTGGSWRFDFGKVKCVTAQHSSGLPDGTYGGNPLGFVIESEEANFYYAGDTALTLDMQLIPMICAPLHFAVLPIGDNFTMGYQDAAIAANFIKCDHIVGCHYDTFGYIQVNNELAKRAFRDKGKTLFLPEIGETVDFEVA